MQTPDPKKVLKLRGDSIPEGANPLGDLTALDGDATVKDTVNETTQDAHPAGQWPRPRARLGGYRLQ